MKKVELLQEVVDGVLYIEEWMPIKGYESLYELSNFGRFFSVKRDMIIHPEKSIHGYMRISLFKEKKYKKYQAHRLIGSHFIHNPQNKPQINHKKGIKTDNRFHQLEWVTRSENILHAIYVLKIKRNGGHKGKFGGESPTAKKIKCMTTGKIYPSVIDASIAMNLPKSSIAENCRGLSVSVRGFKFSYI